MLVENEQCILIAYALFASMYCTIIYYHCTTTELMKTMYFNIPFPHKSKDTEIVLVTHTHIHIIYDIMKCYLVNIYHTVYIIIVFENHLTIRLINCQKETSPVVIYYYKYDSSSYTYFLP